MREESQETVATATRKKKSLLGWSHLSYSAPLLAGLNGQACDVNRPWLHRDAAQNNDI